MLLSSVPAIAIAIVVSVIVFVALGTSFKIVPQAEIWIVERLGKYKGQLGSGPHFILPIFDRIKGKIQMKEQLADFPPQPVITKDNVTMQIDTVVYFQVTDAKLYMYGIVRPIKAIENLTATTLRNIIGELDLDGTLTSRDIINTKMRNILDEATDPWGIKINRVELKNILPPRTIQEAMEKQMKAERERREAILKAEGEKNSAILVAQGEKEAAILRATAEKEATIAIAEGKAEALRAMCEAQAAGIKAIQSANPGQAYISIKGIEALQTIGSSESTKIVIPSNLQDVTSLITSVTETVKSTKKTAK